MIEDSDIIRPAEEPEDGHRKTGPEVPEPEEWRPFGFEW